MIDFSKREKILLSLLLIFTISTCLLSYYAFFKETPEIAFKFEEQPAVPVIASVEPQEIVVYVTGAVKKPGVYSLKEGDRVKDAIAAAGGHLSDADLLRLNLAQKLRDEDKLYVPRIGEAEDRLLQEEPYYGSTVGLSLESDGKININTANQAELTQLPGIGEVTAQKIIDYRNKNGFFKTIEEIKNVSGIGDKKFEQIREKIKVR